MVRPDEKSMITQRITIDGREALLVLPQTWDPVKKDWVVTDGANRLPVDAVINADDLGVDGLPTSDAIVSDKLDDVRISIEANKIPDIQGVKDIKVEAKLIDIEAKQSEILAKLNNAEDSVPVIVTNPANDVVFPDNQKVSDANVASKLDEVKTVIEANKPKELQNVKDAEVKAELETIKQSVADNKATNDLILARLDGTIDTQVTGSSVANGIAVKQISKNVYFKELVITNSTPLVAGKDEIIDVHAKAGEIWRIVRFGFEVARNSDSAGTYEINLHHGSNQVASNWIAQFKHTSNQFLRGTVPGRLNQVDSFDPVDRMELMESIRNTTIVSNVLPMRIRLRNASDKDMGKRQFRVFYYAEAINNE